MREDRDKREKIMKGIVVYHAGGRACISDRINNRYLPGTMSQWQEEIAWDWRRVFHSLIIVGPGKKTRIYIAVYDVV